MNNLTRNSAAIFLTLAGVCVATGAWADSNQVASGMGHELARHICSSCHLVDPGQVNPPDHVGGPTFQSVADRSDVTVQSLRRHLRNTHTNAMVPLAMPNPGLTEDELVKIISYIISLKTHS